MNEQLTEIVFILDKSGSMSGLELRTIDGFNEFVKNQRNIGETLVTTVLFDDKYELLHRAVDARYVSLTESDYRPGGMTALLDAVGKTIIDVGVRLSNTAERLRPKKVIFVITTDGQENSSREFSYAKINEMISHQRSKYNWEFVFLGANIDVEREAVKLGIPRTYASSFRATDEGIKLMYETVSAKVSQVRETK